MMTPSDPTPNARALAESERQTCLVVAALLAADKRLDWIAAPLILSLILTAGAMFIGTVSVVPGLRIALAAAVSLGGIERYLALRITFDQRLFALLGRDGGLTLSGLDQALRDAHLIDPRKLSRPLVARFKGAVRLVRLHVIVMSVQIAIVCGVLFLAGA